MLSQEEYRDYCERFRFVWGYIRASSYDEDFVIQCLCSERGYSYDRMNPILSKIGVCFVNPEKFEFNRIRKLDRGELGICSPTGNFLLMGRYIVPVRDMLGNIIALIGWYNQEDKKYVTTPSKLFSKECLFYGMEQFNTGIGKKFIVVEGIFDSISVRSLGLRCVAMMGITPSRYKTELFNLMGGVLAIPDNDKEGRKVLKEDIWGIPSNGKYLRWSGSGAKGIKDIDDLVKSFEAEDVREMLLDAWKEPDRTVNIILEY